MSCVLWPRDETEVVIHSDDQFAQVGYFQIAKHHLEPKSDYDASLVSGGEVNDSPVVLGEMAAHRCRVTSGYCVRCVEGVARRASSMHCRGRCRRRFDHPWRTPGGRPLGHLPLARRSRYARTHYRVLTLCLPLGRLTLLSGQFFVRGSVAPRQQNAEAVSTVESQLDQLFAAIKGI